MIMQQVQRFFFLLFAVGTAITTVAQIHHVEPLNWWVGMKNPNLQLLIHGTDIGETTPQISYPGVVIKKFTKGDSRNYLFLDLVIDKTARPGSMGISFRKGGKEVYNYRYQLQKRMQDGAAFKGFTTSDVIYLLVPDRFVNGDPSNDMMAGTKENKIDRSFPGGRHGGDIRGIINSLDYLKEMGFTAIWPTPMLENNMPAYSYHGYSITNHYQVDPRYGTLDEFKELAVKMRERGLKLIFDEVLNHIGSHYWWMNDLPFQNWLNYPNNYVQSNHRRTVNMDQYASQFDIDLWKNGWFDKTMPDMNGANPFVANYLIQKTIWWIETLQLGGVRQDTYGYSDKKFLQQWTCSIMKEYPNFNIVGEEWSTNPLITSYWQQGKKNHDGYTGCLKTVMDFPLQEALVKSLTGKEDAAYLSPFTKMYEALANDFVYPDPANILVFGDNHDMNRLFEQLNRDVDLMQMALAYLFTIRGIPQVFYGTEVLMDHPGHNKVDGLIRSDFPGGWAGDTVNAFTGAGLSANQKQVQSYVKQLLNWRKNNEVIANGQLLHFAPFDGLYVYFRFNKERTIMVVLNKNTTATSFETARFKEIIKGKTKALNVLNGEWQSLGSKLSVSALSTTIFELQ